MIMQVTKNESVIIVSLQNISDLRIIKDFSARVTLACSLIRLAATCRQRISKRDIWGVNVANSCEDVIDTVMRRPVADRRSAPLSLYLASQLMFGLAYVSAKQHEFLLEDIKTLIVRLGMFKVAEGSVIDLDKTLEKSKVTMSFNMDNVPLGFGSFKSIQDPLSHYWGDYFAIPTPKSSEESLSLISAEQERGIDMFDEGAEMLHRAHPADITMQEVPELSEEPIPEEIPEEPVDFLSDFPPLEEAPLEQIPSVLLPETRQATSIPADEHHLSFLLSPEDVPVLEETLQSRQGVDPSSGDMTIQGTSPVIQPRTSMADFASFILGPVPVPGQRRPRRRHLIIDPVISISSEQLRAQLSRVDTQTVPAYLRRASLHELPESMFRRLSSQLVPSGIRNRLRRLQTLQQPTDLFPYVVGLPDESFSSEGAEMLREEEGEHGPSAAPISETFPSVEMQRDATASTTDPSASGLLKTSLLRVTGLSSSASLMGRDVSDSLQPPMTEEEEYMMPIPEPVIRDLEEVHETTVPMPPICEISPVSPERTPPPSSAESLTPALEETHLLVLETLERSGVSHLTTFSAVLRNVTQTKRRVAELFNHLIHLHARGLVYLEQPVADGDIFIKLCHSSLLDPN